MSDEIKTTAAETSNNSNPLESSGQPSTEGNGSYDGGEINGSIDSAQNNDDGNGNQSNQDSPINSVADIFAAARGEQLAAPKTKSKGEAIAEVKENDKELSPEELDETVEQQAAKGKLKNAPKQDATTDEGENQDHQQQQQQNGNQKDFTGIPPEKQWAFKHMPNKAFEFHKNAQKEISRLQNELVEAKKPKQGDLPQSYMEHPQAYQLSPTYQKVAHAVEMSELIEDHWLKQQVSIQTKGKWQPLVKDEQGNLKVMPEQDATEQDRIDVNKHLSFAQRQLQNAENKHQQFVNDFKTNHQRDVSIISQAEKDFFPDFDKPDHPTKKLQDEIASKIPESLHNSPLFNILCKTGAANALMNAEINRLTKELNTLKGIKKDAAKAQPSGKSFTPAASNNGSNGRINSTADILKAAIEG